MVCSGFGPKLTFALEVLFNVLPDKSFVVGQNLR